MVLLQATLYFYTLLSPAQVQGQSNTTITTTVDQMIGVNTRPADQTPYLQKFNHVRSYHSWAGEVGFNVAGDKRARITEDFKPLTAAGNPNDLVYLRYKYNQSLNLAADIRMDDFYGSLSGQNITPCLKDIAPQMRGMDRWLSTDILEQKQVNLSVAATIGPSSGSIDPQNNNNYPNYALLQANHENANLYRSYALNATMFAARYGNKEYPALLPGEPQQFFHNYHERFIRPHLHLGELSPNLTGLAAVNYMEVGNEVDRNWLDRTETMNPNNANEFMKTVFRIWPREYAAQLSAVYDGNGEKWKPNAVWNDHFRIQGPGAGDEPVAVDYAFPNPSYPGPLQRAYLGIKNTDPSMKVVMAGLADFRGKYIEEMAEWCAENRGNLNIPNIPKYPFDVINVHHYSTEKSGLTPMSQIYENHFTSYFFTQGGSAITPEEDRLKEKLRFFRNRLVAKVPDLAGMPIWFTEFGYDTQTNIGPNGEVWDNSQTLVPVISGQSRQKTQAQWLTRTLLEIAASKVVEKADVFELRDDVGGGRATFQTSGLLNRYFQPKESYYYVQTVKNVLKGYKYEGTDAVNFSNTAMPNVNAATPPSPAEWATYEQGLHMAPTQENNFNKVALLGSNLSTLQNNTKIYRFENGTNEVIYAIWSPTKIGATYSINI